MIPMSMRVVSRFAVLPEILSKHTMLAPLQLMTRVKSKSGEPIKIMVLTVWYSLLMLCFHSGMNCTHSDSKPDQELRLTLFVCVWAWVGWVEVLCRGLSRRMREGQTGTGNNRWHGQDKMAKEEL